MYAASLSIHLRPYYACAAGARHAGRAGGAFCGAAAGRVAGPGAVAGWAGGRRGRWRSSAWCSTRRRGVKSQNRMASTSNQVEKVFGEAY